LVHESIVRLIHLDQGLGLDTANLAADLGLRGADATYVAVAHRYGLPLLTRAREQAERAGAVISVQTPGS
jgi:predicted nucleic acid-binding protein